MNSYEDEKALREKSRLEYIANSNIMAIKINAVPECRYGFDCEFRDVDFHLARFAKNYGGCELNPDFQRGVVWTEEQQIKYVEAFIRGAIGDTARTITFNCPLYQRDKVDEDCDLEGFVVVDGLQRLTAVIRFMNGEFTIFNDVFEGGANKDTFNGTKYSLKSHTGLRFNILNMQHKHELLSYYLAFNDGGVVHSREEIDRVTLMRNKLLLEKF